MNQDELNQNQLAEEKALDRNGGKSEKAKPSEKAGALSAVLKNPIFQLLIPLGGETLIGVLPFWTGYVIYTYFNEKKAGRNPNIAEYMMVGGAAAAADAIDALELTGVGKIVASGIDIPTVLFLMSWKMYKRASGVSLPSKVPTKPKVKG